MKTYNDALLDISNNKEIQFYIDTLWLLKHSMKNNLNASDVIIKLLAIENYFGENDFGFELYNKMQKIRVLNNPKVPNYRAYNKARFIKIINSFQKEGFNDKHPIIINNEFMLFEGTHRMACALYFKIKRIPVTFDERMINLKTDYSINWFKKNNLEDYEPHIIKRYKRLLKEWK